MAIKRYKCKNKVYICVTSKSDSPSDDGVAVVFDDLIGFDDLDATFNLFRNIKPKYDHSGMLAAPTLSEVFNALREMKCNIPTEKLMQSANMSKDVIKAAVKFRDSIQDALDKVTQLELGYKIKA